MKYRCLYSLLVAFIASSGVVHAAQETWTLGVIADQQIPTNAEDSNDYFNRFTSQTDWIAANAASNNLRFVAQVGDIVEHADNLSEWSMASTAMATLDLAANADGGVGVPWSVAYGNHEGLSNTRNPTENPGSPAQSLNYRNNFGTVNGTHRYAGQNEFGGVSSNDLNTYHVVRSSDAFDARSYLMLSLEFDIPSGPSAPFDTIAWAQSVIDDHPDMPTVISTHIFEGSGFGPPNDPWSFGFGHNGANFVFDELVAPNNQVFMVLSGHTSQSSHTIKLNDSGEQVLQVVTDLNGPIGNGGNGFFRLVEIDEEDDELRFSTYSAFVDQNLSGSNHNFTFGLDFDTRFGELRAEMFGDFNDDGLVSAEDLDLILANWGQSVGVGTFAFGDANGDGAIGVADLNIVLNNWGSGTPPEVTVPEPSAALLMFGIVCLVSRRGSRLVSR